MSNPGWKFRIDRGGTFTDVIGVTPAGAQHSLKLLSTSPAAYNDAAAEGIRRVMAAHDPAAPVSEIRMGTTVATNALLERKGARTGLLITRGFGDTLLIGNQDRPNLFDLHIRKAPPLFSAVAEVDERLDASGQVLKKLQTAELESTLTKWRAQGIHSIAISLVHAWLNPAHEKMLADLARSAGFEHVHVSHEVNPLMKLVSRTGTTVADAYLSPVLMRHVANFHHELHAHGIDCKQIFFMQSNGGLTQAERFRGKDAVLSGPAGGVVGMQMAGAKTGLERLIGFDMGGTSTDVSVCAGMPEIVNDTEIAGIQLRTPMIRIHTIAAGGGSLLNFDNGRFQVGPASAGADPGPLCYGRDGPLALTDANLMLGRIQARYFPLVFGKNGKQSLDKDGVQDAFAKLADEVSAASGQNYGAEETAEGFLQVAIENMANALRHISVSRGLDPAEYTLCCFGGAGAQHACRVADRLQIRRVLLDPQAAVLSAWGMGVAPLRSYRQRGINETLSEAALAKIAALRTRLTDECRRELIAQGADAANVNVRTLLNLKAAGTDTALAIELDTEISMQEEFSCGFRDRFGFEPDTGNLHIDSMRCEAMTSSALPHPPPEPLSAPSTDQPPVEPLEVTRAYLHGHWQSVPVYDRDALAAQTCLNGPALIVEPNSTTVLESGWALTVNEAMQLLLERDAAQPQSAHDKARGNALGEATADPIKLEIINNRFVYIAEEMGAVLRNTAQSVNIKERLDFSCALFTADGDLIANAPHVPVHLGSMDDAVKAALNTHGNELRNGHVLLSNAPYSGGTHLPDVTAISAVTSNGATFIVASRAHHADIGGITPGSMPPFSQHIEEEGVLIEHFSIVRNGEFQETGLRKLLGSGRWPARNPNQNVADFKAQIAANERGRKLLLCMLDEFGHDVVMAYANYVQDNTETSVRDAISNLSSGAFTYPLDSGQQICVRITVNQDERSACIDFSGTSAAAHNNLNAPRAVCQAAVLYVFRTLVHDNIPLNAGCNKPLELIIPTGSMLDPSYPAAVVGGNVETSQCITDALYGALGLLAGSQGTMNNLSFGSEKFQYYETIGGGSGAGKEFAGADAVQTHMTNTRITDVEVMESRFPVLLREFSVRHDSGGAGRHCGGNGTVRILEFREAMSAAILSGNRINAPFGLCGGSPGEPGRNCIVRRNSSENAGTSEAHEGALNTDMEAGDVLIIETPGGGGYGTP